MTSFVTDLLVNPVLRQARRFSLSRSSTASNPPESESPPRIARTGSYSPQDDTMSEAEETEGSSLREDPGDSVSSRRSSQSSLLINPHVDVNRIEENHSRLENAMISTNPTTSTVNACASDSPGEPSSAHRPNMTTPEPSSWPLIRGVLRDRSPLPEDDGMGSMRKRIFAIQAQEIGHSEKAHLMHQLLMEGYTNSRVHGRPEQPLSPSSPQPFERTASQGQGPLESFKFWQTILDEGEDAERFYLTDKDLEPTFVPDEQPTESITDVVDHESDCEKLLGCEHYRRNVKLQCSTCNRWYTCRFCHNKVEDHSLIRKETRNMLCMFCGTAQRASQTCVSCGARAARYYCDICKLWNDDPDKPCYHCNDCGICRIGNGIGKDFYHCKKCCACIAISAQSDHKCIERAIDCDCPICGDYMFTSPKPVRFMKCGHSIHRDCLKEHQKTSYKCPICSKSLNNMESQFRNLEISIQAQPMPPEFRDTRAIVLCHDCSAKSSTMYHWLGLKCGVCQSYNTAQLQIIGLNAEAVGNELVAERNSQVPGLASVRNPDAIAMSTAMGNTRRRHSSTVMGPNFVGPDVTSFAPDRLARSVSPILTPGRLLHASMVGGGGYFDREEEEDDDGDMFGFWRRIPRSLTSNHEEDEDDDVGGSSDELSSDEDMEEDGEESDDDDFELLGHR
ncbi:hypothetical protein GGR51DRAFT_528817 [Nemania sp. FL0031]|nr:hypothetical protein GGR51DRAFT_528817 [Nemania sp. FL0031]